MVVKKAAFTLIELIFAIVIIAITVVSLPMMTQATSKGIDANLVQEAIFGAAAKLNEAVTANWDEKSLEVNATNSYARVIDIDGNGDGNKDCNNVPNSPTFRQMPGHINQPLHRRCLNSATTTPSNTDVVGVTSLSDMTMTDVNITTGSTDKAGYKDAYTSTVTVSRPANFNGSNNNIKLIRSTIKDSDDKNITTLSTYSANIGEVDYYKRSY